MRRWTQRTHLAGLVALTLTACARGEHVPGKGGIAVTDDASRRVTLVAPARRIVSLLPSFTEILFAIGAGDQLVGRTTWCDYPPEALAVPSVGDGMPPSVEAVAARRPDLVVLYRSGPNVTAAEQLERLGIRTVILDLNRLEDLGPVIRRLGVLTARRARRRAQRVSRHRLPFGPGVDRDDRRTRSGLRRGARGHRSTARLCDASR